MKHFAQRYAQQRNRRRAGSGKLFEERFLSKPVWNEEYLAWVTAYIDYNPELAAACPRYYRTYPWSALPIHTAEPEQSRIPTSIWTPTAWYERLAQTPIERGAVYDEFVQVYAERAKSLKHIQQVESELDKSHSRVMGEKRYERPDGRHAI